MLNKEKLLKVFIFSIFLIAVYLCYLLSSNYNKKFNNSANIIKNVKSKIKFGKSPMCGDSECWYTKNYNDRNWDIVPLPKYDFRIHPEYKKGLKEGYVYYRIKIEKINHLNCDNDYYIPISLHDDILKIREKQKVSIHYSHASYTYERNKIHFRLPVDCKEIKKNGCLIVMKSKMERGNNGLYSYYSYYIVPNEYDLVYTEGNNYQIISRYWTLSLLLLFILLIYIFLPKFKRYELFYILNSLFFVSHLSFFLIDLLVLRLFKSLGIIMFIFNFLSLNLLNYIKENYFKYKKDYFFSYLGYLLLLISVISYIFYYFNFYSWTLWNFFYTTKISYLFIVLLIVIKLFNLCFYLKDQVPSNLKEDLVFFSIHLIICIHCIINHISWYEALILITGSLFFLYKKISRIIQDKKIDCEKINTLNEMNQYKNIGKVYSALTHDLKKPFSQIKYLLETDPIDPIPNINHEIILIKKEVQNTEKTLDLLLKVASNNMIERNIETIKLFIESIDKKKISVLNKVHSKYNSWTISKSNDFIETFSLICKHSTLNNANIIINQINIHFKKYLQITLPIKISNNFDYIEESSKNKKAPAQIYLDTLEKSFIKKIITYHQDYTPYEESADGFKIKDNKTILYLKMSK